MVHTICENPHGHSTETDRTTCALEVVESAEEASYPLPKQDICTGADIGLCLLAGYLCDAWLVGWSVSLGILFFFFF